MSGPDHDFSAPASYATSAFHASAGLAALDSFRLAHLCLAQRDAVATIDVRRSDRRHLTASPADLDHQRDDQPFPRIGAHFIAPSDNGGTNTVDRALAPCS